MDQLRTLEEIKNDIRSRVGHRAPFNHADKQEAEEVLSKLNSVDGEAWAAVWNELGALGRKGQQGRSWRQARSSEAGLSQIIRLLWHRPTPFPQHPR